MEHSHRHAALGAKAPAIRALRETLTEVLYEWTRMWRAMPGRPGWHGGNPALKGLRIAGMVVLGVIGAALFALVFGCCYDPVELADADDLPPW